MSTNGTDKQSTKTKEPLTAETVFASWTKEGGLELAAERVTQVRALVDEVLAADRLRIAKEREELKAKSEAMEAKFRALGFPGGPPLDDAEQDEAKKKGLVKLRPTPPSDDETLRKMLIARILTVQKEHPNNPAATRGLSRWSGATGERIKAVLEDSPEVTNGFGDRWVARQE